MNKIKTLQISDFYKKSYITPDGDDLTTEQNQETLDTYELSANEYSNVEWARYSCLKSNFDTRRPFLSELFNNVSYYQPLLVAGCGSGRDVYFISKSIYSSEKRLLNIIAFDYSKQMIELAKLNVYAKLNKEGLDSTNIVFENVDIRNIKSKYGNKKFGSIFCESVLSHLSINDLNKALEAFHLLLVEGGIAFLGFRQKNAKESNVYTTEGDFGKRHYIRLSIDEIRRILFKNKFEIIWGPNISSHTDEKRPPFVNVIVRKISL